MTGWTSVIIERFKSLCDIDRLSGEVAENDPDGESEDARASRLVANARIINANDVRTVHEALTVYAFSGYGQWHCEDDDAWTKNCLGQVLSESQSSYLASVLNQPEPIDLATLVQTVAGRFVPVWRDEARSEATQVAGLPQEGEEQPGLNAILNDANWQYTRTPGTRYYIFYGDQYLFSDDQTAELAEWAAAEAREEAAKNNAAQWAPGIFYTPYANPSLVEGVPRVYGLSEYGPWNLAEEEAVALASAQAQAASDPVAPADLDEEPAEPDLDEEPADIDLDAIARQSVEQALAQLGAEPESPQALERAIALVASALKSSEGDDR
jgi:hypothetical protein